MAFTSAMLTTGKYLANNKKQVKNNPKVNRKSPTSYIVGENIAQLDGMKSLCNEVQMITKRSNHIPMFTMIDKMNVHTKLLLTFLNQNNCGVTTLQVIMLA